MSSAACLKRSYSCRRRTSSARGSPSSAFVDGRARQQHARFDLGQDRGHHQVFGGELEAHLVHRLDVVDVLARDLGDRDVEDVEVLAADQVQQQVQRTFERIEDDLERIRRDVQILRDLQHRLAAHHRQRHFLLLWGVLLRGMLREACVAGLRDRVGRGFDCHASVVVELWPTGHASIAGARAGGRGRGLTWITFAWHHVGWTSRSRVPAPVRPCPRATGIEGATDSGQGVLKGRAGRWLAAGRFGRMGWPRRSLMEHGRWRSGLEQWTQGYGLRVEGVQPRTGFAGNAACGRPVQSPRFPGRWRACGTRSKATTARTCWRSAGRAPRASGAPACAARRRTAAAGRAVSRRSTPRIRARRASAAASSSPSFPRWPRRGPGRPPIPTSPPASTSGSRCGRSAASLP